MEAINEREAAIIERLKAGETTVLNMKTDQAAVAWAKQNNLFARIDRKTDWGNPFIIPRDGDRETVCRNYGLYLQNSPDLLSRIKELKGKALGCWCSPQQCHGDTLKEQLNFY